jgi:hypothetical protein
MAHLLVEAVMVYLAVGVALGLVFVFGVIDRVDHAAHGAHAFRPLLLPGLALLWPLVLVRTLAKLRGRTDPAPSQRFHLAAHRVAWLVLAVLIPVALGLGWALSGPIMAPLAVRLGDAL